MKALCSFFNSTTAQNCEWGDEKFSTLNDIQKWLSVRNNERTETFFFVFGKDKILDIMIRNLRSGKTDNQVSSFKCQPLSNNIEKSGEIEKAESEWSQFLLKEVCVRNEQKLMNKLLSTNS